MVNILVRSTTTSRWITVPEVLVMFLPAVDKGSTLIATLPGHEREFTNADLAVIKGSPGDFTKQRSAYNWKTRHGFGF